MTPLLIIALSLLTLSFIAFCLALAAMAGRHQRLIDDYRSKDWRYDG